MAEFTIRQLQYFVAVLDHGSVTAAAKESNISQAAASMAIAQLEHAVGVDLLIRTRAKKVVATPAGLELAARARHILSMIGDIEGAVAGGFDEMRGALRTGCSPTLSRACCLAWWTISAASIRQWTSHSVRPALPSCSRTSWRGGSILP